MDLDRSIFLHENLVFISIWVMVIPSGITTNQINIKMGFSKKNMEPSNSVLQGSFAMYLYQITAASKWLCHFCWLGVFCLLLLTAAISARPFPTVVSLTYSIHYDSICSSNILHLAATLLCIHITHDSITNETAELLVDYNLSVGLSLMCRHNFENYRWLIFCRHISGNYRTLTSILEL